MRDSIDYYNFLCDTLQSFHHQIPKIYNKLGEAYGQNKYINIRTGYLMKKRYLDYQYYYSKSKYPLCWNFSKGGLTSYKVINRIFRTFSNLLDSFKRAKDEEQIKKLIEEEIRHAKQIMLINKQFSKKNGNHLICEEEEDESISEDEISMNNERIRKFIVNETKNEKKKKYVKIKKELINNDDRTDSDAEDINKITFIREENGSKQIRKKVLRKKRPRESIIIDDNNNGSSSYESKINLAAYGLPSDYLYNLQKKQNVVEDD